MGTNVANQRNFNSTAISWLFVLYMILNSAAFLGAPYQATFFAQLIGAFFFFYALSKGLTGLGNLTFLSLFLISILICSLFVERPTVGWGNQLSLIGSFGILFWLRTRAYNFKVIKFCFYFASLLLLVGLIAVGPTEFAFNLGISKNSISIFLTTKVLVFYVLAYIQRDRLALLPAWIHLFECTLIVSRGGMLCAIFLLLGLFFLGDHKDQPRLKTLRFWCFKFVKLDKWPTLILCLSITGIAYVFDIFGVRVAFEKNLFEFYARSDFFSGRIEVYQSFFKNMTAEKLIFGESQENSIAFMYQGNTHNSLLGLWQYTGVFGLFVSLAWFIGLGRSIGKSKIKFLLTAVLTLRLLTEHFLFFTGFDFLFFVLLSLNSKREFQAVHYDRSKANA